MRKYEEQMRRTHPLRSVLAGTSVLVLASALFGPLAVSGAATPGTSLRATVTASGAAEVQRYLNTWILKGETTASQTYLVRSQWVPKGQRQIKLVHGSLAKFNLYKWVSKRHFTLLVTLRMAFSGWYAAWNKSGVPDTRFVTFFWSSNLGRYQMEFSTGP